MLATFALLALLTRVLIAPGYMIAAGDQAHTIEIAFCSGEVAAHTVLDLDTGRLSHGKPLGKSQSADTPCTFASLADTATPAAALLALPMAAGAFDAAPLPREARLTLTPTGPPLPARGPPKIA